jgi:hypothetical protein
MISANPVAVVAMLALAGIAAAQERTDEDRQLAERAKAALRQVRGR